MSVARDRATADLLRNVDFTLDMSDFLLGSFDRARTLFAPYASHSSNSMGEHEPN
jgi:hypothetical protein